MSSKFKATSWEGHRTLQLRTAISSIFLDEEDVPKLAKYLKDNKEKLGLGGIL